ncbi:MAG: MBL fold metallo-hydrolase [Eubacterium sp.]|nr:MBL fold metallo-hydrolase [Eubacterium sp.]
MKVTFLHHSSFLVELEHTYLLFDYFAGSRVNGFHFTGTIPKLASGKELYVFASHKHHDHFDMDTLKLADQYPNVHFIFSKDCKMSRNFLKKHGYPDLITEKITYTAPEKKYEVGSIKVRTLTSTDAGVAFSVTAEDQQIYHAGDLNWWHWEGVGDLINGRMERMFKREMRKIADEHFHLAFVLLDPRQGKDAFKGFGYFMQNIDADHVFPMHMWQDYSLIEAYKKRTDNDYFLSRIVDISKENEVFEF